MNDRTLQDADQDEQQLAGIIRRAGARAQPAAAARDAVRSAVHSEWRAAVADRRRQRTVRWSLAAAAVVAALAVWIGVPLVQPPGTMVATVSRVAGPVSVDTGSWFADPAPAAGTALRVGAELRSGAGGRVALRFGGASVRIDQDSVVALVATDRIALRRGAVYVDSGADSGGAPLLIETPLGTVEHLGTQYETRLADGALRVMVREGRVRLQGNERVLETSAGEQLTLRGSGDVRRQPVGRSDGAWAWVGEIAPAFDIDNRPLPEFLGWVSRETGRDVVFASASAEQAAGAVVLGGSVAGLSPLQALSAVLATTDLSYSDEQHGRILIDLKLGD